MERPFVRLSEVNSAPYQAHDGEVNGRNCVVEDVRREVRQA
jgi:hypothetical protein